MAGARVIRRRAAVLLAAVAADLAFGEPPARVHPVAWLGKAIARLERRAPATGRERQLIWGVAVGVGVPAAAALAGLAVERGARRHGTAGFVTEMVLLKCAFAVRALVSAAEMTRRALADGTLETARDSLRSLVSRDTADLSRSLVAAAAIESLAENTTDSFIAPWLAYVVAGLPGAWAYRALNTLDSMIGYRGRYEYLGKPAARLDDLVNLAPARLSALLLAVAAPAGGGFVERAARGALRDHGRTASPNAGWTIGAMAGALGRQLEKPGAYVLGSGSLPEAHDIRRAQRIVAATAAGGLAALVAGVVAWGHRSR